MINILKKLFGAQVKIKHGTDHKRFWQLKKEEEFLKILNYIILSKEEHEHRFIVKFIKKLKKNIDTTDYWAEEFMLFNEILGAYVYFDRESKEIDSTKNVLNRQNDYLNDKIKELERKLLELNKREAKIIKIEAAQKILNSNLVDKINNEGDKND